MQSSEDEEEVRREPFFLYRVYLYKVEENTFDFLFDEGLRFAETIQELGILRGDHLLKLSGRNVRGDTVENVRNTIRNYRQRACLWFDIGRNTPHDVLHQNAPVSNFLPNSERKCMYFSLFRFFKDPTLANVILDNF